MLLMTLFTRGIAGLGVLVVAALAVRAAASPGTPAGAAPPSPGAAPIVVELFSSEGCSSCPSAEAFLREVDAHPPASSAPMIALEYHVDYWDYLGWKDPFARHEFTERQEGYARAFGDGRMYTPQIVVQGRGDLPARSAKVFTERLRREAAEPMAHVVVGRNASDVTVHVDSAPAPANGDTLDVVLAITESNLVSEVRAGENRGETLAHAAVVRRLTTLGQIAAGAFDGRVRPTLDPSWNPERLRFVVLVQGHSSRRIHGAGYR
jgi:hypothetical protein